jgi:hypothetical protein
MGKPFFQALSLSLALLFPAFSQGLSAAVAQNTPRVRITEIKGFIYAAQGLVRPLDATSSGFTSNFEANGLGSFGWRFTNTTGATLEDLRFVVFLDADIDRDANTFFNEHGAFVSLAPPPGAPAGAIAASSWEIDEAGFLSGDLARRLATGGLDNANAAPAGAGDDVALALGFRLGALANEASADFAFSLSATNIGGLIQTDPDSNLQFHFNGYSTSTSAAGCVTTCFRSPQYYALNLNRLSANAPLRGTAIVIGGMNSNQPVSVGNNVDLIRLALRGGPSNTPLTRLNQEFAAAQLSLAFAGGRGSPEYFSVLWSRLRCYRGMASLAPVRLTNGFSFTPDSMLADLFQQALFAIRENRTADMDALTSLFDRINGNDPLGRCN